MNKQKHDEHAADSGLDAANCSAWFILYDGSSPDGRGCPQFYGRTTDPKTALKHFKKCKRNPYSTGQVRIVTDTEEGMALNEQSFAAFILPNAEVSHGDRERNMNTNQTHKQP